MKRRTYRVWTRDDPSQQFEPQAGDAQSREDAYRDAEILKEHGITVKILPEVTEALGDWT